MRRLAHSGDTARLVHWNVRRCLDPASGKGSSGRVLACVQRLRPTVLSLNELDVTKSGTLLAELAAHGLRYQSFFGHVRDGTYGNALLSTEPLLEGSEAHTHLDGGSVVRTKSGDSHRIARGMLSATVALLGVSTRIAVTHLDHMSAEQRRVQMGHVISTLRAQPRGEHTQTLLLGDLNALSRADYAPAEWAQHEAHNAAKGWGAPHDDDAPDGALRLLADEDFVDCAALLARRPQGAWPAAPWTAHVRVPGGPRYRIDYAWLHSPRGGNAPRLVPTACRVEMDCGGASDHQPLVLDLAVSSE